MVMEMLRAAAIEDEEDNRPSPLDNLFADLEMDNPCLLYTSEQIVRLSLEGFEVAVRLTGSAAKNIAILLASVLKQEISQSNKTRGKARLTNMIKSGKDVYKRQQ